MIDGLVEQRDDAGTRSAHAIASCRSIDPMKVITKVITVPAEVVAMDKFNPTNPSSAARSASSSGRTRL